MQKDCFFIQLVWEQNLIVPISTYTMRVALKISSLGSPAQSTRIYITNFFCPLSSLKAIEAHNSKKSTPSITCKAPFGEDGQKHLTKSTIFEVRTVKEQDGKAWLVMLLLLLLFLLTLYLLLLFQQSFRLSCIFFSLSLLL